MARKKFIAAAALALACLTLPAGAAFGQAAGAEGEGAGAVQGFLYFSTPVPELAGAAPAQGAGGHAGGAAPAAVTGVDTSASAEGWKPAPKGGLAEAVKRIAAKIRDAIRVAAAGRGGFR